MYIFVYINIIYDMIFNGGKLLFYYLPTINIIK